MHASVALAAALDGVMNCRKRLQERGAAMAAAAAAARGILPDLCPRLKCVQKMGYSILNHVPSRPLPLLDWILGAAVVMYEYAVAGVVVQHDPPPLHPRPRRPG